CYAHFPPVYNGLSDYVLPLALLRRAPAFSASTFLSFYFFEKTAIPLPYIPSSVGLTRVNALTPASS
ncbi:hypothetical protein, partial [Enterococcus faecalis]|uniref:hypothetical protein n=1 Tax=Enterococcus faecalis TaxID=1351 RepID=UPI00242E0928